jgi:hypothetical protein
LDADPALPGNVLLSWMSWKWRNKSTFELYLKSKVHLGTLFY